MLPLPDDFATRKTPLLRLTGDGGDNRESVRETGHSASIVLNLPGDLVRTGFTVRVEPVNPAAAATPVGAAVAGRIHPAGASLEATLAAYEAAQTQRGRDARHIRATVAYVRKAAKRCSWAVLTDVTEDTARVFLSELTRHDGTPATPKYYNNVRSYLTAFGHWCVRRKLIEDWPVDLVESQIDRRPQQLREFTPEDLDTLLAWLPKRRGGADAADCCLFTAYTGLRRGTVKEMRVFNLELGNEPHVHILPDQIKTGRELRIPLVDARLLAVLKRRVEGRLPGDRVFPVVPHPNIIERDLARCGLVKVNDKGQRLVFHSLRHSFGTLLARAGVGPKTIQELMGHLDIRTTFNRYIHSNGKEMRAAVASLPGGERNLTPKFQLTAQQDDVSCETDSSPSGSRPMLAVAGNRTGNPEAVQWAQQDSNLSRPQPASGTPASQPERETLAAPLRPGFDLGRAAFPGSGLPGPGQTSAAVADVLESIARLLRGGGE